MEDLADPLVLECVDLISLEITVYHNQKKVRVILIFMHGKRSHISLCALPQCRVARSATSSFSIVTCFCCLAFGLGLLKSAREFLSIGS